MADHILPSSTVWPIALLIACVVLEAGALRFGVDDLDEGYFVQQGARVLHGQVPYRDFFSLYTPGLAYAHAALFALSGAPSIEAARGLSLAARAVLALLLFALARPFVRNAWWAALPGVLLLVGLDDAPVRWEPHPGWLSTLFAVLAVWCLTHRRSTGWLVAAGAAAGLSYAFKQNTGLFILAAIVAWCWLMSSRERNLRNLRTLGATLVPVAGFVVVTLVWLVPLVVSLRGDLSGLGVLVGAVNQASLFSPPEPTLLIPLAAVVGGVWLVRHDSHPTLRWYLLAGLALFATEFPRMDTLHLAWSAPVLLVLGAIALSHLAWPFAALSLVGAMALLAPTWSARLTYFAQPLAPVADVVARTQTSADLESLIADIQQRTRPGEPIFVYPTSPLVYVLADRPNPTRFDHLNPGAATPEQVDQVIADLQRSGTRLIVISDFWESVWGPPGDNAALEDFIAAHYTEIARHGAYRVLIASGL
ncbi:MAG TPA: glycosyltransferase family 39 protein [Chloroflexota bacterium]